MYTGIVVDLTQVACFTFHIHSKEPLSIDKLSVIRRAKQRRSVNGNQMRALLPYQTDSSRHRVKAQKTLSVTTPVQLAAASQTSLTPAYCVLHVISPGWGCFTACMLLVSCCGGISVPVLNLNTNCYLSSSSSSSISHSQ